MQHGGSLVTMSYLGGADEAVPHYVYRACKSRVGIISSLYGAGAGAVRYSRISSITQPYTILTRAASGIEDFDQLMKHAIEKAPLGRLVTTEEVANLTAFLCSDDSSGMTGQTIYVDDGCHAVT